MKSLKHYAWLFAKGAIKAIESLTAFSYSGRTVPEYNFDNVREIIWDQNYRIVYRINCEHVKFIPLVCRAKL
ncbi:MAG: ParE toxin of type II toxin-antitoxin system, parDE [Candidatus Methanocomedens sp.]|jgi:hypothetical protein|nr:MAG: ParE toxin of type II toxin-antitoxin system, parDE [ANME-2 cluster archaeon]